MHAIAYHPPSITYMQRLEEAITNVIEIQKKYMYMYIYILTHDHVESI